MLYYESLILILLTFCATCNAGCPNPHLLHPCTCLRSTSIITCEDLDNEENLKSVIKASKNHDVVGVELISSALRFIPEDTFEGSKIKFLRIINSSVLALSETHQAFVGLEKSLKSLVVVNCPFVNAWEWSHMSNLTMLEELEISESGLIELTSDFLKLSKHPIQSLNFLDSDLHSIPDNAFNSFKNLRKAALDKNKLTEIQRSIFPRPAKYLETLGLSDNRLSFLPRDMFLEMPKLKFLYLGSNNLHSLDENIFRPVWKQLSIFEFHGTPLFCDCRLSWLVNMKNEGKFIIASCANPRRLKNRKISTLESDELQCSLLSWEPKI